MCGLHRARTDRCRWINEARVTGKERGRGNRGFINSMEDFKQ
jgi:hypothetical protein